MLSTQNSFSSRHRDSSSLPWNPHCILTSSGHSAFRSSYGLHTSEEELLPLFTLKGAAALSRSSLALSFALVYACRLRKVPASQASFSTPSFPTEQGPSGRFLPDCSSQSSTEVRKMTGGHVGTLFSGRKRIPRNCLSLGRKKD